MKNYLIMVASLVFLGLGQTVLADDVKTQGGTIQPQSQTDESTSAVSTSQSTDQVSNLPSSDSNTTTTQATTPSSSSAIDTTTVVPETSSGAIPAKVYASDNQLPAAGVHQNWWMTAAGCLVMLALGYVLIKKYDHENRGRHQA